MNELRPSPTASALALSASVLATLTALLGAAHLRLAAVERAHAWPWPSAAPPVGVALAVIGAIAGLAAAAAWSRHRDPDWRRALIESLLWPSLPVAAAWLVMPASGSPGLAVGIVVAVTAMTAWWLCRQDRGLTRPTGAARPGRPRLTWIGLHLLAVVALMVLGVGNDGFADPGSFFLSLVLYPIYAYCQLFLILAVTWPRMDRLAGGNLAGPVTALALLFALVHWPNPMLMALTGGGMAFWGAAYARGRGLVVLAVSMGLLASLAAQGLPDHWTDHMRAGPRFVHMRTVPLAAQAADARTDHLPAGEARTTAYIAAIYPSIVGREATNDELARWWRSIAPCQRAVVAWRFFGSDEYARKVATSPAAALPGGRAHWTALPEPWPIRIGAFTDDASGTSPLSWDGFIGSLYREILGRDGSDEDRASWREGLSRGQRQRLVRVMLDQRRYLARAPFDTCGCAEMGLR